MARERDRVRETAALALGDGDSPGAPLSPLLGEEDHSPCRVANPHGRAAIVLTCDHASHRVPRALGTLGIERDDLVRHIGWDPGAEDVTLRLARRFDAPAVLSGYSRLVIDCNRRPGAETSVPAVSDGTRIPGNLGLSPRDVRRRVEGLFVPYHDAIARTLRIKLASGVDPAYVAIHTFTPRLNGFVRPWHFGVLWDRDGRIARPLIAALRENPGVIVGDNQPYSGRDHFDFSQDFHATAAGLPCALVEIRSDLVASERGVAEFGDMLGDALAAALATAPAMRDTGSPRSTNACP